MGDTQTTLVNFVARGDAPDEWKMVLVEAGPWSPPFQKHLERFQERLYGCVDAIIDGQLAERFPETEGCKVVVQVDCYDLPEAEVGGLFNAFAAGIFEIEDYRKALVTSRFVKEIGFQITFDHVH